MNDVHQPSVRELLADRGLIQAALQKAARKAVLEHARAGRAITEMTEDGEIVTVQPAEILAQFGEQPPSTNGVPTAPSAVTPPPA